MYINFFLRMTLFLSSSSIRKINLILLNEYDRIKKKQKKTKVVFIETNFFMYKRNIYVNSN